MALVVAFWFAFQLIYFLHLELGRDAGVTIVNGHASYPWSFSSVDGYLGNFLRYITQPSELFIVAVGAMICFGAYLALRRIRDRALWVQLVAATFVALLCAASFTIAVSLICTWFGVHWPQLTKTFFMADTLRWLAPFGLWAGITLNVTYNSEMRERERRMALLQAQAQDARMRALRYQVNPHLLYNTLNSIAALILAKQNDVAEAMVLRLSDFFRASLSTDPHADVPLAEEIARQHLYLDIERMRFPSLSVEVDTPEELAPVPVPSLILQPLIENALKHGINPGGAPTNLRIASFRQGHRLVLEVSDNGPGTSDQSGTGVGLDNVRERLQSRFGAAASLHTESVPGSGFRARLTMPVPA